MSRHATTREMQRVLLLVALAAATSCAPATTPHAPHPHRDLSDEVPTYEVACGGSLKLGSLVGGRVVDASNGMPPLPSNCHSSLYCHNCNFTSVNAMLESVTLIKTDVDLLQLTAALSFFYAGWSNLSNVTDLVFSTGAQTSRFEFSTIKSVQKITAMSDTSFNNCNIENITSNSVTSFSSFTIANSSISRIESKGIVTFGPEGASFQNVIFEELHHGAVVVTGAGDLVLQNVTIRNCKTPCFEVPSHESIKLLGHVFMNGTELNGDDVLKMINLRRTSLCEASNSSAGCFNQRCLENTPKNTENVSRNITIDISGVDGAEDVLIQCGLNTTLHFQKGAVLRSSLTHHQAARSALENRVVRSPLGRQALKPLLGHQCSVNPLLSITNSSFRSVALSHPVSLRVDNSCVEEARGPLDLPRLFNSRMGMLREVAVRGPERVWTNAFIGTIRDSSFEGQHFSLVNSSVTEQIRNLTVGGSLLIQKSFIHAISSVRVLAGGLITFHNSSINFLGRESIFLERGALISFTGASVSVCPQDAISLVSYDQVLGYDFPRSRVWLPDLASLRLTPTASLLPPTLRSVSSSPLDARFCALRRHGAFCNYASAPLTDILHSAPAEQVEPVPTRFTYTNASSIVLNSYGYSADVVIENTGLIYFPEFFEHASLLLVRNSAFGWLHTRASSLVLRHTSAGVLKIISTLRVSSESSSVAKIAADVHSVDFRNTFIETIVKMKISSHAVFVNCSIQTVGRLAIFVAPNATLEIRNSTIDVVNREGFIVKGNVIFDHVHIASLSSFGLLFDDSGRGEHTLRNVTFGQKATNGIFNLAKNSSVSVESKATSEINERDGVLDGSNSAFSQFLSNSKNSFYKFISYLPEVLKTIQDSTLYPVGQSKDNFPATSSKNQNDSEVNLTITFKDNLADSSFSAQPVVINVPEDGSVPDVFTLNSVKKDMPHHKFSIKIGMDNTLSPYRMCSHALHRNHSRSESNSLQKHQIDLWVEFERCVSSHVDYVEAHEDHITRASTALVQFDIRELWVQVLLGGLLAIVLLGAVVVLACCCTRRIAFHRALRELEAEQMQAIGDQLSRGKYFRRTGSKFRMQQSGSSDALYLIKTPHNMACESSLAVYPPTSPVASQKPSPECNDRDSLNSSLSFTETTPDLCLRDSSDPSQSMQCLADSQTHLDDAALFGDPEEGQGHQGTFGVDLPPENATNNSVSRQCSLSVVRGVLAKKLLQSSIPISSSNSSPTSSDASCSTANGSGKNDEEPSSSSSSKKVILPVPVCDGPENFEMEIFF